MKTLVELLNNKPFIAALITVIVATGTKLGFDVDKEYVALMLGFGAIVVGALGLQSQGADAAKIYADADGDGIPDDEDPTPNGEPEA